MTAIEGNFAALFSGDTQA